MARLKFNSKRKTQIFYIVLAVLVFVGTFSAVAHIANSDKSVSPTIFSVGALDDNGQYVESDVSVYTKDAIECQGLKVTPAFDAQGTYRIFFYNEDDIFLSSTTSTLEAYNTEIPELAKYARIMITPEPEEVSYDEDEWKIRFWETAKYAKGFKITVDRNQEFAPTDYYATAKLYAADEETAVTSVSEDYRFIRGAWINGFSSLSNDLKTFSQGLQQDKPRGYNVVKLDCTEMSKYIIRFGDTIGESGEYYAYFYDANGNGVKPAVKISAVPNDSVIVDVPEDAVYMCINTIPADLVEGSKEIPIVINGYLPR